VTIGIRPNVVGHARHVAFRLAEAAIPRTLFADILRMISDVAGSAGRINWMEGASTTRSPQTGGRIMTVPIPDAFERFGALWNRQSA